MAGLTPFINDPDCTLWCGDALSVLRTLDADCAQACVTSPPYGDARPEYPTPTPGEFTQIFHELARVLTDCCLVNVGRRWAKGVESLWWVDLLHSAECAGWSLLDTLVWVKPNANPIHGQIFADRHEYILILGRAGDRLNEDAVRQPYADSSIPRMQRGWTNHVGVKGDDSRRRGRRSSEPHPLGGRPSSYVSVHTGGEKGNPHPAPMPLQLAEHLVKLATWPGQIVLDPFAGSGTTALAARKLERSALLIERDTTFAALTAKRLQQLSLLAEAAPSPS